MGFTFQEASSRMVQTDTFRSLGYFFATVKIVLSVLEAVKCTVKIGGIYDFAELIMLILAFVYIVFSLLLIIGIRTLKTRLIHVYKVFTILTNTLMILYTVIEYLIVMIIRQQMEKGLIALIIIVVLLAGIFVFEIWLINGISRYVKKRCNVKVAECMDNTEKSLDNETA